MKNRKEKKHQSQNHHKSSRYGSKRRNPNGKITTITPSLEFITALPYERSTDKWDEEVALLWYVEQNPKCKADVELQKLIEEIKITSQAMERLILEMEAHANDVQLTTLQKEFVVNRNQNYAAIDEAAVKVFGDCGMHGSFADLVQYYIGILIITRKLRPLPITEFI